MTNRADNEREFFAPLHGLRGIAVLYVVVSHLGNEGAFLIPVNHDAVGKVGVWIFFALSAFLLTTHLYRDFLTKPSFGAPFVQYAINRVFRIFPLYLLVIAAHTVVRDFSVVDALQHVLLVEGWGELWAIPVEFQYYLLIPLIALAAVKLPRIMVGVLLAAGIAASVWYGTIDTESVFSNDLNILPRLAPFLLGSALAVDMVGNAARGQTVHRTGPQGVAVVCLLGLIGMTLLYRWMLKDALPSSFAPWISLILGISVVGLIAASLQPGVLARVLGAHPLVFLGEISFSLYLLHMFIVRFITRLAHWPDVVEAWVSLSLSILVAYLSYRLVEKPGIRAGKRFGQFLRPLAAKVPAALPVRESGKVGPA